MIGDNPPTKRDVPLEEVTRSMLLDTELEVFSHDRVYDDALDMAGNFVRGTTKKDTVAPRKIVTGEPVSAAQARATRHGATQPMTTPKPPDIEVLIAESPPALAADASELFMQLAQQAASAGNRFRVALSGGSTPRLLYGLLASDAFRSEIPWDVIQFFFGDERWVPHTHRDSNYKMAKDQLFNKVGIDPSNIFGIPTEGVTPDEAAEQYAETLRKQFKLTTPEVPVFDLMFLGMGDDGHTASLFPHTPVLKEREKIVAAYYVDKLSAYRVTLTMPVLTSAAEIIFLVTGEGKAPALKEVLEGEYNFDEYPSQLYRGAQGKVIWYVDNAAASQLQQRYRRV